MKRPSQSEPRRTWSLGDNTISEQAWYKHVGILLYSNLRTVERTLTACRKLRGTSVSIVGVGLHPHSMNPITGRKIYERIVLPSALYGCELWSDLTRTEIKMLETAHKFCLKFIQGLHPRIRNATCLALLGIGSIYPVHIWIDTVPVQTVPVQFGSVRNCLCPYLFRDGTDPPVHITN